MFRAWYESEVVETDDFASLPDGIQIIFEFKGRDEYGRPLGVIYSGSDWYWEGGSGASHEERGQWIPYDGPEGAIAKKGLWIDDFAAVNALFVEWLTAYNETRA